MLYKDEFKKIMDEQTGNMLENIVKDAETAMCELNLMLNSGYITEDHYFKVRDNIELKDKDNICGFNLFEGQREADVFQDYVSNGIKSIYGKHPCDIFKETSVEVLHGRFMPQDATVEIVHTRDRHGVQKVIKNENILQRKLPDHDLEDIYIPWTNQIIICKVTVDIWTTNNTTGPGFYSDPINPSKIQKVIMYVPHDRGERLDMDTILKEKGENK